MFPKILKPHGETEPAKPKFTISTITLGDTLTMVGAFTEAIIILFTIPFGAIARFIEGFTIDLIGGLVFTILSIGLGMVIMVMVITDTYMETIIGIGIIEAMLVLDIQEGTIIIRGQILPEGDDLPKTILGAIVQELRRI